MSPENGNRPGEGAAHSVSESNAAESNAHLPPTQGIRTTSERAAAYGATHEQRLIEVITRAIFEASFVSDLNVTCIRTGEQASALLTVLAATLAMSPSAVRSPTAIRKLTDDLGKTLRRKVAAARADADFQSFTDHCFRDDDEQRGGRA